MLSIVTYQSVGLYFLCPPAFMKSIKYVLYIFLRLIFLCSPVGLTERHFWCIRKEIFKILLIKLVVFARFSLRRNCQHQNRF